MKLLVWMLAPSRTYEGDGFYYHSRHKEVSRAAEEAIAYCILNKGHMPEKIELTEEREGKKQ